MKFTLAILIFFGSLSVAPPKVNNFRLKNLDNKTTTYKDIKGDTYTVIDFWATWCKPCIKELPYFETAAEKYADKNVKVLLVSMDFPRLLEKQVIPFIEKNNIKSPVVLLDDTGANEWIPKVDESWSGAIPATVIYNAKERKFYERSFTLEDLEKEINTFL